MKELVIEEGQGWFIFTLKQIEFSMVLDNSKVSKLFSNFSDEVQSNFQYNFSWDKFHF